MREQPHSVRSGINWSFIAAVAGILALLVAYSQTHLTEIVESVQALPELPSSLIKLVPALLTGVLRGAPDFVAVALLLCISGGIGRLAVKGLQRIFAFDTAVLSHPEQAALYAMTGMGLVSIGAMLLGIAGLFRADILWLSLAILGVLIWRSIFHFLKIGFSAARITGWTAWDWSAAALVMLLLAFMLLLAISPPAAWDALTYHLVAPSRYLREGIIAVQPDNTYLGFSQTVETLFGVTMGLFNRDTPAGLLHWVFGVMGIAALAALVNRIASKSAARFTVVLIAGSFSFWSLAGIPYVDLALFALAVCMMSVLMAWHATRDDGWLVLIGICAGIALGVKYSSGLFLIAVLLAGVYWSPRQFLRIGLLVGIPAAVMFAPWMLRGLLLWGNPVYPFVFGGVSWDAMRSASLSTSGLGMIYRGEAWQIPLLPLSATILGMDGVFEFDFSIGPLLLTAPVLLFIAWRRLPAKTKPLAQAALILALAMTVAWMFMAATTRIGAQTRLVIMALPAFAVAGGVAISGLSKPPDKAIFRVVSGGLIFGVLLAALQVHAFIAVSHVLDYQFSADRTAYLDSKLGGYIAAMRQLDDLPAGSRVLFLFEPRGYYCPTDITCGADLIFDQWGRHIKRGDSPDNVMESYAANYDYVLLNEPGLSEWKVNADEFGEQNALLPAALDRWMRPVWTVDSAYILYGWRD